MNATGEQKAPEPPSNSVLIQAMENAATHDTPERRELLYGVLLDATLLAITPEPPAKPGMHQVDEDQPIRLVTGSDDEGQLLPLFTDFEAIRAWHPDPQGYVMLPARDVFEHTAATNPCRIAINPGSQIRGVLTPPEIEALARGRIPDTQAELLADPVNMTVAKASTPPPREVLDALRSLLQPEKKVIQAWYFEVERDFLFTNSAIAIRFADGTAPAEQDRIMRSVTHETGRAVPAAASFLFQIATPEIVAAMEDGNGDEFYFRKA